MSRSVLVVVFSAVCFLPATVRAETSVIDLEAPGKHVLNTGFNVLTEPREDSQFSDDMTAFPDLMLL